MYLFATICTNKFSVKTGFLVLNTDKLTFFKGIMSPLKAFEKNKSTLYTFDRVERSSNPTVYTWVIIAKVVYCYVKFVLISSQICLTYLKLKLESKFFRKRRIPCRK